MIQTLQAMGTPRPFPVKSAPPRFGNGLFNVAGLAGTTPNNSSKTTEQLKKKGGVFKLLALTVPVTIALLTNLTTINKYSRQGYNMLNGSPLESVLKNPPPMPAVPQPAPLPPGTAPTTPPPEPTPLPDMIEMLRRTDYIPAPYLYEAARSGFIKEVLVTSPTAADGIVVLIDGTEVTGELTADLRNRLIKELKIPLNRPMVSANVAVLDATLLATLVFSGLSSLLLIPARERKEATQEEKRRSSANQMGRELVARRLKVLPDLLSPDEVAQQLQSTSFLQGTRPLSDAEIKKRVVVALAGYHAEKLLYDGEASLTSAKAREDATQLTRILITNLGSGELFPHHVPQLNDETRKKLEAEVVKLMEESSAQAVKILNEYSKESLANLRLGFLCLKTLSDEEMAAMLKGATVKDIRKNRIKNWFPFIFEKNATLKAIPEPPKPEPPQE